MRNFAFPYFSRDIAEFWRRWHISLSTWLRDYIFFPLRRKLLRQKRLHPWLIQALPPFVTMLVSGLWHGANWTFIVWGALHGAYLVIENSIKPIIDRIIENFHSKILSGCYLVLQVSFTFTLIGVGWIFFRADTIAHAFNILTGIFSNSIFSFPPIVGWENAWATVFLIMFFILLEWLGRENQYAIEKLGLNWPRPIRWAFYSSIIFSIGMFMQTTETPFLYFRF